MNTKPLWGLAFVCLAVLLAAASMKAVSASPLSLANLNNPGESIAWETAQANRIKVVLPKYQQFPVEQRVYIGGNHWVVTNAQTGQFIRVEMSTSDLGQAQPIVEQAVNIGGSQRLVTNAENGQYIRMDWVNK